MMKKIISFVFFLAFFSQLVCASGLSIVGDNNFILNKTVGVDETIAITLMNNGTFTFYNITFEDNPYISMQQIDKINPGQEIIVSANVNYDLEINTEIRIKGIYESNQGESHEVYNSYVSFDDGVNPCDMSIIKGDTINWTSLNYYNLKMYNADTGIEIAELSTNQSHVYQFNEPKTFNYYFSENGWKIKDKNCKVIVANDVGPTQNELYDAVINLIIKPQYDPTTIQPTFIETNYEMSFIESQEGVFMIKNNGDKIAKSIHLSGEWFTFNINDFDLSPGMTKGVSYKIKPDSITSTNDTNKSYIKNITIKGNFDTHIEPFNIFINYGKIEGSNYSGNDAWILEMLKDFCLRNPNSEGCGTDPVIIYKYTNSSNGNLSVGEKIDKLYRFGRESSESERERDNILSERLYNLELQVNSTSSNKTSDSERLLEMEKKQDILINVIIVISGFLFLFFTIFCFIVINKKDSITRKVNSYKRFLTKRRDR